MRFFNTSRPVVPAGHYCIPPLTRVDLGEVCRFVRNKRYFALHAPRQTGKTSILLALRDLLNGGTVGDYRCVYFNVEAGQAAREDTARAMRAIFGKLASRARSTLRDELIGGVWPGVLDELGPDGALREMFSRWAEAAPTCSSSGRRASGRAGSSSNARSSTRALSALFRMDSSRRPATWTAARRKPAIWSSSTGTRRGVGTRKCFVARNRMEALTYWRGGCDASA